jgi:RNA polymerase sigma-70 factor, ECF subfamily
MDWSRRRAGSATSGPSNAAAKLAEATWSGQHQPGVAYQLAGMRKWALGVQTKQLRCGTICLGASDLVCTVTTRPSSTRPPSTRGTPVGVDADSRRWVEQLRVEHPRYQEAVARLHDVLQRVASYELSRRRRQLRSISGPEFDDLTQQAADDALLNVLGRLDEFRGLSRFTTWAYKFAMFEVSAKVARHAWRRQPPDVGEEAWDQLPDPMALRPEDRLEQHGQLGALSHAIGELTDRQREVFVAVALNEVPIDVLAVKLGSNRNAVYKNLFDARRRLRARMAAAGYPVSDHSAEGVAAGPNGSVGPSAAGWSR